MDKIDLKRFLDAQRANYTAAYFEISCGKKKTHWTWYVFPLVSGISNTETGKAYALRSIAEIRKYWQNKKLRTNYTEICKALLKNDVPISEICSETASNKIHSSVTMFLFICKDIMDEQDANTLRAVINKFFDLKDHLLTIEVLKSIS